MDDIAPAAMALLAASVPISAVIWISSARFRHPISTGEADRRIAQIGSAVVLAVGVLLGSLFSLFAGATIYLAGSIWWAWSWSWPGRGGAARWTLLWAPAAPWLFLLALRLVLLAEPFDAPPISTIAVYGLVSAIGCFPSLVATAGLLSHPSRPAR